MNLIPIVIESEARIGNLMLEKGDEIFLEDAAQKGDHVFVRDPKLGDQFEAEIMQIEIKDNNVWYTVEPLNVRGGEEVIVNAINVRKIKS
jgi:hypothetical protein